MKSFEFIDDIYTIVLEAYQQGLNCGIGDKSSHDFINKLSELLRQAEKEGILK